MFKIKKEKLSNGLRFIHIPFKNSQAATLLFLVGTGSKNESKEINGISHFLEHLFFKGTEKRPNPGDIEREIDKIGAAHNAFTSTEQTGYWVKVAKKDFEIGLDVLSDMVLNPIFKEEEIEKERGVILQEINMYEDLPQRKVFDVLNELMYGDQPSGRSIAGTKEIVSKIKREDIIKYRQNQYQATDAVVLVCGDVGSKNIKDLKNKFSKIPKGKINKVEKTKINQKDIRTKFFYKKTDQSHFLLGIKAFDMYDQRRYALALLSIILGGNSSSRMYNEIRQKRGLAYYLSASENLEKDTGVIYLRAGVAHDNLKKAIEVISDILIDIKKNGVTKEEIENAKSYLRGQTAMGFETTDQVAYFVGDQELFYGKAETPEVLLKKIEKVTQNDILKVARDLFKSSNINLAVIGERKDTASDQKEFKQILSRI